MNGQNQTKPKTLLGRTTHVDFPTLGLKGVPSRTDTGAKVSSLWASDISLDADTLTFVLFDKGSEFYTGEKISVTEYDQRAVSSSMGHTQLRYEVRLPVVIEGRRIKARFTLADRSTQSYPILIGRTILNNKFIVDVSKGTAIKAELLKRAELDKLGKGLSS